MSIAGAVFKAGDSARSAAFKGFSGSLAVAGTGFSMYASHQMYSGTYGTGAGIAMGAAEAAMFLLPLPISLPMAGAVYGLPALKEYGQSIYKENRKLNMGQPMQDPFGTMATMRQRSASVLQRGRAVLGSEARLMHY